MHSKRSHEGYLLIDHRAGPGTTQADGVAIPVRGGQVYESATVTCSHCQRVIVLNPERTRERGYCSGCDHYICDVCSLVRTQDGLCRPFHQVIDETLTAAAHAKASPAMVDLESKLSSAQHQAASRGLIIPP